MTLYALIDCNNFYAACERLFDPALADRPVAVLSNNDGCVIARCALTKALGIPMGIPFFKLQPLVQKHNLAIRSSNYELYGDISRRVMQVLTRFSPRIEVYSIDEAFLAFDADTLAGQPDLGQTIRATLLRWVGIPVGVGIGPTKTLAKAANWKAKRTPAGVWSIGSDVDRRALLDALPIDAVWGIGRRLSRRLNAAGIATAADFVARLDARQVQRDFTVTGLRTWRELAGFPCLELEDAPPAKQTLCTSRSFGAEQTELPGIEAAVAGFAASCAEKLRHARLVAPMMQVFLATNRFRDDQPQDFPVGLHSFDPPGNDTLEITTAARNVARRLFRPGYAYKKAGVILSGLLPDAAIQANLFDAVPRRPLRRALMADIDVLNQRFGRSAVCTAATLTGPSGSWKMRQSARTPRYTTRWDEIMRIR